MVISINPQKCTVWRDAFYTGIHLDLFSPDNMTVEVPEVENPEEDYQLVRQGLEGGFLLPGKIELKQGTASVTARDLLVMKIEDVRKVVDDLPHHELEAALHLEANRDGGRPRTEFLEAITKAIQSYAVDISIVNSDKEEVYRYEKPAVDGKNTRARVGEPEDVEIGPKKKA